MLEEDFILQHAIQNGIAIFCNMQCRYVKHCFVTENGWVVHAVLNTFHWKACQIINNTSWLEEAFPA
jgi:hypothetical protein